MACSCDPCEEDRLRVDQGRKTIKICELVSRAFVEVDNRYRDPTKVHTEIGKNINVEKSNLARVKVNGFFSQKMQFLARKYE